MKTKYGHPLSDPWMRFVPYAFTLADRPTGGSWHRLYLTCPEMETSNPVYTPSSGPPPHLLQLTRW